jgi:3-oxoacyl-[acyl-carrier protein] reductase
MRRKAPFCQTPSWLHANSLVSRQSAFESTINAVSLGTIDTNYHRNFSNDRMLSAIKAATPMARLGTAEEVADVILFLFSDEARFIQGQVIEANGGFM